MGVCMHITYYYVFHTAIDRSQFRMISNEKPCYMLSAYSTLIARAYSTLCIIIYVISFHYCMKFVCVCACVSPSIFGCMNPLFIFTHVDCLLARLHASCMRACMREHSVMSKLMKILSLSLVQQKCRQHLLNVIIA